MTSPIDELRAALAKVERPQEDREAIRAFLRACESGVPALFAEYDRIVTELAQAKATARREALLEAALPPDVASLVREAKIARDRLASILPALRVHTSYPKFCHDPIHCAGKSACLWEGVCLQ